MRKAERQKEILRLISFEKVMTVQRGMEAFSASRATIRRDYEDLSEEGLVGRIHGGIIRQDSGGMKPFASREQINFLAKDTIAKRAVELLNPGDVVFIDGGTTTVRIAEHLPNFELRIITNSIRLAELLSERRNDKLEIILTGGHLYQRSYLLVGPQAISSISEYRANWAFLSAEGVSENGLFNSNDLVVGCERAMIERADKTVVLADESKMKCDGLMRVCDLDSIDYLVTNAQPLSGIPTTLSMSKKSKVVYVG